MTPTHAISADEARRLLHQDRENQRYQSALRSARAWCQTQELPEGSPMPVRVATPFGTFTAEELWS